MEKIIAVVLMVAIVVALIAVVVKPMSDQMEQSGATTLEQMSSLNQSLQEGTATGAQIISDQGMYNDNLSDADDAALVDPAIKIMVINDTTGSGLALAKDGDPTDASYNVKATENYEKKVVNYPSGHVKIITYTLKK